MLGNQKHSSLFVESINEEEDFLWCGHMVYEGHDTKLKQNVRNAFVRIRDDDGSDIRPLWPKFSNEFDDIWEEVVRGRRWVVFVKVKGHWQESFHVDFFVAGP